MTVASTPALSQRYMGIGVRAGSATASAEAVGPMANNPRVSHGFRTYRNNWPRLILNVFPRTTPPGSNYYFTRVKSAETSSTSRTFTRMTP
jgi:hypothetical protein